MTCLLDTHVWVWSQECPDKLGKCTREILENPQSKLLVLTISTLEMARLVSIGHLKLNGSLKHWINTSLEFLLADSVDVSHDVARRAYELKEPFHKDPADRLLVSTALCRQCCLITADEKILAYSHVKTQDARK
jgi:PIN domain nuclease of toxin-antitoxin system